MNEKILVAYATRTGTTQEVAQAIGEVLAEKGAAVDVRNVREIDDPTTYQALVLGSGVRAGNLMPEAVEFVEANQRALEQMPAAYFVVCATLQEDTEENRQVVAGYLDPLRELVEPVTEGLFAGAIERSKLSLPLRLMLKAMKAEDGDWRDWDAIRTWAAEVYPSLLQS
jgi:menaquinone-dependent protoporphyrinogen oxidase